MNSLEIFQEREDLRRDLERCSLGDHVFRVIQQCPKTKHSFETFKMCKYCGTTRVDHNQQIISAKKIPEISRFLFQEVERLKREKNNLAKISSTTSGQVEKKKNSRKESE